MVKSALTSIARNLRRASTDAERKLWSLLRAHQLDGYKFRRQQPIGSYVVDFFCKEWGLIVELDGGQHASSGNEDYERSAYLEAQGFRVLRFWNHEILRESEAVVKEILVTLAGLPPHLDPLPRGEGKQIKVAQKHVNN